MKNNPSRRLFLQRTAIATTGLALLSSTSAIHAFTKEKNPFDGYNPYAEEKTDLRTTLIGKHVTVSGKIYDETGVFAIPDVKIEVWHLSPNSTRFRHRAKLKTNELGEYNFITDFPNREAGKGPRIFFKISHNDRIQFTELMMNDHGAYISGEHWKKNNQLGEKLFPKKINLLDQSKITFNISL